MDRRKFLRGSVLAAAAAGAPLKLAMAEEDTPSATTPRSRSAGDIVDTNVDLCGWPYRTLKYGKTEDLVAKLKKHGVRQAWTGSFDAMFHKNLDAVNRRLAEEVRTKGEGILVPFGAVNPVWPDMEEDVRRIDEDYNMAGVKLIPGYHGYTLDDPQFVRLLELTADRGLLVQIAIDMEDERMRHPRVLIPPVNVMPLGESLRRVPNARVMLVNPFRHVRGDLLKAAVNDTNVLFEISNLDAAGGIERLIRGDHWWLSDVSVPADRLVFGSHMPFFPIENALFKFMESELSANNQTAILHGNADRFIQNV